MCRSRQRTVRYIKIEPPEWEASPYMRCLSFDIITTAFEVVDNRSVCRQLRCMFSITPTVATYLRALLQGGISFLALLLYRPLQLCVYQVKVDETTRWSSDVWVVDEHYVTEGNYGLHSSL